MRRTRHALLAALLCLCVIFSLDAGAGLAEASWDTLYTNFLTAQQSTRKARRITTFFDFDGDGTPELVELRSVSKSSRNSYLKVYTIKSGAVMELDYEGSVNLANYRIDGVRKAVFQLRASKSSEPCLLVSVTGLSGGATITTRIGLTQAAGGALKTTLMETRSVKRGKSKYTVNGLASNASVYKSTYKSFDSSYPKKGSNLSAASYSGSAKKSNYVSSTKKLAKTFSKITTPSKVSISKKSLTLDYNSSYKLTASVAPATAIYEQLEWTSSDSDVVRVSNGTVTAVGPGNATVTVKSRNGISKACAVKVNGLPATSVKITGSSRTVVLKDKLTLTAVVSPSNASQKVKWSSASSSIASVSDGVVTGKKMGTTTIKATTENGKTTTYTVTVLAQDLNEQGAIIDISRYNNVSNWSKVQKNVSLVILRCGVTYSESHEKAGQMEIDARFKEYAQQCIKNGIPFGVYYYGMASTPEIAQQEAEKAFGFAKAYNPLFYVYDAEEAILNKASIEAFANRLRELGASKIGCYVAHHRYNQYKINTQLFDFIWIPNYGSNTGEVLSTPSFLCDIHQYSSRGKIPGIGGNVDVNRLMGTKPLSYFTS